MKQEHKEILLKDLCGRLPYGVQGYVNGRVVTLQGVNIMYSIVEYDIYCSSAIDDFTPYLFPLSSMTEEQREEIEDKLTFPNKSDGGWIEILYNNKYEIPFWFVDFCNKNHIDYRGLIPMGLAIDATGLNIYGNVY